MKKLFNLTLFVLMALSTFLLNVSCDKIEENKENPPKEKPDDGGDEKNESDYVFFDDKQYLGDWDASIFGKEGIEYYYKFKEGVPEKVAIWDNNKETIAVLAQFDEKGFPSYLIAGEYALVFDNFRDQYFDLAVVFKDNILFRKDSVKADINWDELTYSQTTKAGEYSARDDARKANAVLASIGCATDILLATVTGGITIPLTFISCGGAIITIVDAACNGCFPPWLTALASLSGSTSVPGAVIHTIGTIITNNAEVLDNNLAIMKAQMVLSIKINALVKRVSSKSAVIELPLDHNLKPGYTDGMSIDIGIFYSEDPLLPETNRRKVSDEKLNWMTLYNGGKIEGRIDLVNLKPSTTYYYMPYINLNLMLTYGERKNFKTQPDSLFIVGTWLGPESSVPDLGLVYKDIYVFYPNGTFTADLNADRLHYVHEVGGSILTEDILTYHLVEGVYFYDYENNYLDATYTSYEYHDIRKEIIINQDGNREEIVKNRVGQSEDYAGKKYMSGTVHKQSDSMFIIERSNGVGFLYERIE